MGADYPSLITDFLALLETIYEADVTQLLSRSSRDDAFFLDLLAPHVLDSDRMELARILSDIRGRLQRMKKA